MRSILFHLAERERPPKILLHLQLEQIRRQMLTFHHICLSDSNNPVSLCSSRQTCTLKNLDRSKHVMSSHLCSPIFSE